MWNFLRTRWSDFEHRIQHISPAVWLSLLLVVFGAINLLKMLGFHLPRCIPGAGTGMIAPFVIFFIVVLAFIFTYRQADLEYQRTIRQNALESQRKKYDLTIAFRFLDTFENKLLQARQQAAQTLNDHTIEQLQNIKNEKLVLIDDVLDFFEDLGFCLEGEQISPEVLHHNFYYWLRGYWSRARYYAEQWRHVTEEVPRWEHVQKLFESTSAIEKSRGGTDALLKLEKTTEFLLEEIKDMERKLNAHRTDLQEAH